MRALKFDDKGQSGLGCLLHLPSMLSWMVPVLNIRGGGTSRGSSGFYQLLEDEAKANNHDTISGDQKDLRKEGKNDTRDRRTAEKERKRSAVQVVSTRAQACKEEVWQVRERRSLTQ